jgi:hypothetical protein
MIGVTANAPAAAKVKILQMISVEEAPSVSALASRSTSPKSRCALGGGTGRRRTRPAALDALSTSWISAWARSGSRRACSKFRAAPEQQILDIG